MYIFLKLYINEILYFTIKYLYARGHCAKWKETSGQKIFHNLTGWMPKKCQACQGAG